MKDKNMMIGSRLRQFRETKKLSQGDVEARSGLLRCYLSRVENGYTVPSVETLEKLARALEIPLYQLFYDGTEQPGEPIFKREGADWATRGKGQRVLQRLRHTLGRMSEKDRNLLLHLAGGMVRTKRRE